MRLDRELGALNREIVAIKEKWKIALNIDSKKVAIEKLITRRKRLRDGGEVSRMVETATKEEKRLSSQNSPPKPIPEKMVEKVEEKIEKTVIPETKI